MALIDDVIEEIKAIKADIRQIKDAIVVIKDDIRTLKTAGKEIAEQTVQLTKAVHEIGRLLATLVPRQRLERLRDILKR